MECVCTEVPLDAKPSLRNAHHVTQNGKLPYYAKLTRLRIERDIEILQKKIDFHFSENLPQLVSVCGRNGKIYIGDSP